jgi:hypothetical protein
VNRDILSDAPTRFSKTALFQAKNQDNKLKKFLKATDAKNSDPEFV